MGRSAKHYAPQSVPFCASTMWINGYTFEYVLWKVVLSTAYPPLSRWNTPLSGYSEQLRRLPHAWPRTRHLWDFWWAPGWWRSCILCRTLAFARHSRRQGQFDKSFWRFVMMLYAKSYPKVVKLEQPPPSHGSWRTGTTVATPWIWWWRVVEIPVPFCGEGPPKVWRSPTIIVHQIQKNSNALRQLVVLSARRTRNSKQNYRHVQEKTTKKETGN